MPLLADLTCRTYKIIDIIRKNEDSHSLAPKCQEGCDRTCMTIKNAVGFLFRNWRYLNAFEFRFKVEFFEHVMSLRNLAVSDRR